MARVLGGTTLLLPGQGCRFSVTSDGFIWAVCSVVHSATLRCAPSRVGSTTTDHNKGSRPISNGRETLLWIQRGSEHNGTRPWRGCQAYERRTQFQFYFINIFLICFYEGKGMQIKFNTSILVNKSITKLIRPFKASKEGIHGKI